MFSEVFRENIFHFKNFSVFALQELVAASPNQRNWKGISIAIFVIVAILASVAIAVYIKTPEEKEPRVSGSRFGIEHILDERFSPPGFNGSWISGTCLWRENSNVQDRNIGQKLYFFRSVHWILSTNGTMMFHLYGYVSDVYSIVYFLCLDTELLFRDATGGLSILTLTNYAMTQILSNTTFVS